MRPNDLRDMTNDELEQKLLDTRQELFNLRFQAATGALENTARLKQAKKDLARALTVAGERSIDVETEIRRQRAE